MIRLALQDVPSTRRLRATLPCFLAICLACCRLAAAADASFGTPQNPAPIDVDYHLQGEFTGWLSAPESSPRAAGLQVVALGNGEFRAVEYPGGLPGNGGDMRSRRIYSGQRGTLRTAEFAGQGRRLQVHPWSAEVRDASGRLLGRLARVQRISRTLGARPPAGAQVLFLGRDAREFTKGNVTYDHFLVAGADTNDSFGDFSLHVEFRTPYMPGARGQGRGNSGVYLQERYEVQILDSFGLEGADNECGGLYKQRAPRLNMCFPPLIWQTYDIDFMAARFDPSGRKLSNARISARHNGVLIHDNTELIAKTGGGAAEGPDPRPIRFQDHGNPVHFRNIWLVKR